MELVVLDASPIESSLDGNQVNIFADVYTQTLKVEWKKDLKKPYTVSLFNLEGKKLWATSPSLEKEQKISLETYPSGIYMVQIFRDEEKLFIQKIIK
ncbi:MAG: T9SS type A sorting domain-containing protein [Bacteroidia bacterium]